MVFGIDMGEVKRLHPRALMIAALDAVYPPQCVTCDTSVAMQGDLCAACWAKMPFVSGSCCDKCGVPLPGLDDGRPIWCDDCLTLARPWDRARAALVYDDLTRGIVLGLKYRDKTEYARPAARWLLRAAAPLIRSDTVIAPVPLHPRRLFARRYNQAALLSAELARLSERAHIVDLLQRIRFEGVQRHRGRAARFVNLSASMQVASRHAARVSGAHVLLVDDVMTTGATLAAAAEAVYAAGADLVDCVVLTRVTRADTF